MTIHLPKEMMDLLDLELITPSQSEYVFKGYYPVLKTHLIRYSCYGWYLAAKVKVSKNLDGWYYYGAIQMNSETDKVQHLIRLKRQIEEASLYVKETKIKNKLKKIKEDF